MTDMQRGSDLKRLYLLQGIRAFVYGFGSILLGATLGASGASALEAGLVFASLLTGSALASLLLVRHAETLGRRRVYLLLYVLMGIAGTVFAFTGQTWALVLAGLTGTVSVEVVESGPFTSVEQAMIPEVAASRTTHAFGIYNAVASLIGAAGALAARVPAMLHESGTVVGRDRIWFVVYPIAALVAVPIAAMLSSAVENPHPVARGSRALRESRGPILRMSALFALDSFAGGFIVQSYIVFWFTRKFGASTELLSGVLAATGVIQAGSFIVATRLARRVGLLNTMVFTHLPSNIMLMALPFAPTLTAAWVLFLVRFPLSQMDVPTRQGYLAALTPPDERAAGAAVTNASRTVARPFGALAAGLVTGPATAVTGLPFVISGGLKIVYDLWLWAWFQKVPIDDPARRGR